MHGVVHSFKHVIIEHLHIAYPEHHLPWCELITAKFFKLDNCGVYYKVRDLSRTRSQWHS